MPQDIRNLVPSYYERLNPDVETVSAEVVLMLLLRIGYNLSPEDINRVKTYGRIMFESGCRESARAILERFELVETPAAKTTLSSKPMG